MEGDFNKSLLDPELVRQKEGDVTRGWKRLAEIQQTENISILDYPLPSDDPIA